MVKVKTETLKPDHSLNVCVNENRKSAEKELTGFG